LTDSPLASLDTASAEFAEQVGGFESASLQVMYGPMPEAAADRSIQLFAEQVMPTFRNV
jgi:hypothetical protein